MAESRPPGEKGLGEGFETDELVMALIGGTTTLSIYPDGHPHSLEATSRLVSTLRAALRARRAEEISLVVIDEDVAVDGEPWKRTMSVRASLVRAFRRAGVDRITIRRGCSAEELGRLLQGLGGRTALEDSANITVGLVSLSDGGGAGEAATTTLELRYDQVMSWFTAFESDPAASFGELESAVQRLLEATLTTPRRFVLMASLENDTQRLFRHSINVCLSASRIARSLDIEGPALLDIALAALLHDVGYLGLPEAVVWRKRPLEASEQALLRQHPELGAARLAATDEVPPMCLIAAYEHHQAWNGKGGYPATTRPPHLVSRITAVADHWDTLLNAGAGLPLAQLQEIAIRGLEARAGSMLDPDLVARLTRVAE